MPVTPQDMALVDALVQTQFPNYIKFIHPEEYQATATMSASQAANVTSNASVTINGVSSASNQVPQSQLWSVIDVYITSTTNNPLDAQVKIVKNGQKTMTITAPLSANLTTNNTRPGLRRPAVFEPNSILTLPTFPNTANGTSVQSDTFFIAIVIYDSTFA